MRTGHDFHAGEDDLAKVKIGKSYRCIEIGDDRPGTVELALYFPNGVPAEKLQTIADAINDALDTVRAEQEEAA